MVVVGTMYEKNMFKFSYKDLWQARWWEKDKGKLIQDQDGDR